MKIGSVGLLLAFAGFLQESKCMDRGGAAATPGTSASTSAGTSAATISATVVVTWWNLDKFTAVLPKIHKEPPSWVINAPRQIFSRYQVYFRTCHQGDFEGELHIETQGSSVQLPKSAEITVGSKMYMGSEGFKRYEIGTAIKCSKGFNYIFITIPGTMQIYFEKLIRNAKNETRKHFEERIQDIRAMYANSPWEPISKQWGLKKP